MFCFLLFGILTETVFVESTESPVTQRFITTKKGFLDLKNLSYFHPSFSFFYPLILVTPSRLLPNSDLYHAETISYTQLPPVSERNNTGNVCIT